MRKLPRTREIIASPMSVTPLQTSVFALTLLYECIHLRCPSSSTPQACKISGNVNFPNAIICFRTSTAYIVSLTTALLRAPTAGPNLSCVIARILLHRKRIRHMATSNSYISSSPVSLAEAPLERTTSCWMRTTRDAIIVCRGRPESRWTEKRDRRPRLRRVEATL